MSQRTEPREVFQRFGVPPILCAADFPDTVKAMFNTGATGIDGRTLHLHDSAVGAVDAAQACLTRPLGLIARDPGPLDSPSASPSRTPGRT